MGDSEFLLIPHERVGVLIGPKGQTKREIEKKTSTEIIVDSEEGEVEVVQQGEPLKFHKALQIVKAIGRGFSPEHAFRLLKEMCTLQIIELEETIGKSESNMKAKRGRVIGKSGRMRENIEEETGALVSVYGKTISIIGTVEEIEKATKAVQMLLGGAAHTSVYDSLKKKYSGEKFEL